MQTSSSTLLAQPYRTERQSTYRFEARAADAAAVEELTRATGVFSADEVQIARELVEENLARGAEQSGYHLLFADGVGRLDGYACFGPIPMTTGRFELYWIAVHPGAARSGLGRKLTNAVEEWVREDGGTHVFATTSTRADYAPAHVFYEAQGFTKMADVPDYHSDGDGMAMFGKKL